MKRILSLFIILVLMLSTFASCKPNTPTVEEPDIKEAIKTLDDMYEDLEGTSIPNGKELVAQVKVGKTVFTVTWESDNANVTFTYEGGLCKVNIVTVEEHSIIGGLGSAVAEVLSEEAPCKLTRIGINDEFGQSGKPADLLDFYGLNAKHIAKKVKEILGK